MTSEFWIQLGETVSTVIIAGIVAYTARQQHKLDKYKFNWDMYDRRLQVFKTIKKFIGVTVQTGNFSMEQDFNDFWRAKSESDFIFEGTTISAYFDLIWKRGCELHSANQAANTREALADEDKRKKYLDEQSQHFAWFSKQLEEHVKIFKPFLEIKSAKQSEKAKKIIAREIIILVGVYVLWFLYELTTTYQGKIWMFFSLFDAIDYGVPAWLLYLNHNYFHLFLTPYLLIRFIIWGIATLRKRED